MQEEKSTDARQFYYECINCQAVLRPLDGGCCVFCSYADTLCPPKQMEAMSSAEIPTNRDALRGDVERPVATALVMSG